MGTRTTRARNRIVLLVLTVGGLVGLLAPPRSANAGPKDGRVPPQQCSVPTGTAFSLITDANAVYNDPACGFVDDFALLGEHGCQYWGTISEVDVHHDTLIGSFIDISELTSVYNAGVRNNLGPNWMLDTIDYNADTDGNVTLEFSYRKYICNEVPDRRR